MDATSHLAQPTQLAHTLRLVFLRKADVIVFVAIEADWSDFYSSLAMAFLWYELYCDKGTNSVERVRKHTAALFAVTLQ